MADKRLTPDEARRFLELLDKVNADMNDAFTESMNKMDRPDDFADKWGASPGSVYTTCSRNKYRRFIENAYLDDDEE